MTVSLDKLFLIAEQGPLLDEVEGYLRAKGRNTVADSLLKLQQDAGVAIDRAMTGYDPAQPAPGRETAQLNADYSEVSFPRLMAVLGLVSAHIGSDMKTKFTAFAREAMKIEAPSAAQKNAAPKP